MSPRNNRVAQPLKTRSVRFDLSTDELLQAISRRLRIPINTAVNRAVVHFAASSGKTSGDNRRAFLFPWRCEATDAVFIAAGSDQVVTCPLCGKDNHCLRVHNRVEL